MRALWIGIGCLFGLLILAVIGAKLWVDSYLRSEAFRQLVSARTGQALHAEADYQPLQWSGSSVFSAALDARGDQIVESLQAQQVRADVDWRAIFDGAWRVRHIDVERLDATLRTDRPVASPSSGEEPRAVRRTGWLPSRFELGEIRAQSANVTVGAFGGVRDSMVTLKPEGAGWIFDGRGGTFQSEGHPALEIGSFRIRLQQGAVYVTEADLRLGAGGSIRISGEIGGGDSLYDLRLEGRGISTADVLDATWQKRLTGTISGEARSAQKPGEAAVTAGSFRLTDGMLEGVPAQKEIARFTQSPQFEHMPVHEISGKFVQSDGRTVVREFVMESQGLVRIEGECTVGADRSLAGKFRVGVTSQTLQWLPGSQERVFVVARNGYLWTNVTVGGTIDQPTEDLSNRLATAVGEQLIETGTDLLKDSPEKANDVIDRAVDILSPFLR